MKRSRWIRSWGGAGKWCFALAVAALGALLHSEALATRVSVVDQNNQPVRGFRWLLEEDTSRAITPGVYQPPDNTVRLSVYRSYSPVVKTGRSRTNRLNVNVPRGKKYFLSVLPDSGHTLGGTLIEPRQRTATVVVQKHPLPTAQITVKVFHDINPINNAPDAGEAGIPGFKILLLDQLGQTAFDAFGNPLGTTYQTDASGNYVLDADGNPVVSALGNDLYTDANGEVTVRFLAPGKYGVRVVPRPTTVSFNGVPTLFDDPNVWSQTATIEGSPTVDAWVRANEPPALVEFGKAFWHVFIGFVNNGLNELATLPNPSAVTGTIVGNIRNVHQSRPPAAKLNEGVPVPEAWIGLNVIEGGLSGKGVYGAPADPATGAFSIPDVPPGTYQLTVWDTPLDQIFGFQTVVVPETGGVVDMGNVLVNAWFGRLEGSVFSDDGGGDPSKADNGFRDPGEVGIPDQAVNLRFRDGRIYQATATGADGGYSLNEVFPFFRWLVAEVDYLRYKATGNTVVVDNGGVIPPDAGWDMPSDNVRNPQPQATINPNTGNNLSRTEVGPTLLEAMILYADHNHRIDWGKHIYQPGENGGITGIVFYDTTRGEDTAVDNVGDPWQPGIPNVRVNLYRMDGTNPRTGKPNLVMVNSTLTDSWDANIPTDCPGDQQVDLLGSPIDKCSETLRTWNQVRPGVFDGGYAFEDYYPSGIKSRKSRGATEPVLDRSGNLVPNVPGEQPVLLTPGQWVVEVVPPAGYKVVKEEDKNVDFGDVYKPSPQALLPPCVGNDHLVPAELSLFPGVAVREDLAGTVRPLCDRKRVDVVQDRNAAADFFLFTDVPKAAKFHGMITNDLTNTFNPADPNFAEKLSPKWVPISLRDFQGNLITRTYSDQWGGYHVMVPSTYTINPPIPTGVSPSMVQVCLNDPGENLAKPDPFYNPAYGFVCYNFDAWPGSTTNLDTPLLPVGAFTGAFANQLDCELPDGTPRISQVVGGPYVAGVGETVTLQSVGSVAVQNPDFDSTRPVSPANSPTLVRDYGFGARGSVTVNGVPLNVVAWSNNQIRATVPAGVTTGQLLVTRGDNLLKSVVGITLTVGGSAPIRVPDNFPTIQAAVDNAANDALILVGPGVYAENVVVYKPLKLQGWGEGSTFINGLDFTLTNEQNWVNLVQALVNAGTVDLVTGQRPDFLLDRGAAVTVLAKDGQFNAGRIDGFTLTQSVIGGGVFVSGFADNFEISNNRIASNSGNFGGGIRIGWPANPAVAGDISASIDNLRIHNNHLKQNGGTDGAGGIAIYTGANGYEVRDNFICGNLSGWQGGGIGHQGESDGTIRNNSIVFNEVTTGDKPIRGVRGGQGGGILISGEETAVGEGNLTPGSGNVIINANLIQGNGATHDGGGIALVQVNGLDVSSNPSTPDAWHFVQITNNMIVNNVAQMAGGGISLGDAARVSIVNNTVAHNDSTATNRAAFLDPANPNLATAQVGGIVSRAHSAALAAAFGAGFEQTFSNPLLHDSILWNNRSFAWDGAANGGLGGLLPGTPAVVDHGVAGVSGALTPTNCILTGGTDPLFAAPYFNELFAAGAGGEGGNFVSVVFNPLKQVGNYHIVAPNNVGQAAFSPDFVELGADFDGNSRARTGPFDAGADQFAP
jgi:hypothetical protein